MDSNLDNEVLERRDRLESYLDSQGVPKGRSRSGAIAEMIGCTGFTARRIINGNLPRPEASKKLIAACENKNEDSSTVKENVKKIFHGVLQDKNIIVMGYVAAAVEIKAMELDLDLNQLNKSVRENLWTTIYDDANDNGGKVDSKVVSALLVNLKKEHS